MRGDVRCKDCGFCWEDEVPDDGDLSGLKCPHCADNTGGKKFWPTFVDAGYGTYATPTSQFQIYKAGERIKLGKFCSIGADTLIVTGGNHRIDCVSTSPFDKLLCPDLPESRNRVYWTTRNTELGNDVWVGARAIIGGGAHIGSGSVIGAGAVMFSDCEPYSIVIGNPGRPIKKRFDDKTIERLLKLKWWDWPTEVIEANLDWFYRPVPQFLDHFGV